MRWDDAREISECVETMILLSRRDRDPAAARARAHWPCQCTGRSSTALYNANRESVPHVERGPGALPAECWTMLCGHMSVCAACGGAVSSVPVSRGGGSGVTAGLPAKGSGIRDGPRGLGRSRRARAAAPAPMAPLRRRGDLGDSDGPQPPQRPLAPSATAHGGGDGCGGSKHGGGAAAMCAS